MRPGVGAHARSSRVQSFLSLNVWGECARMKMIVRGIVAGALLSVGALAGCGGDDTTSATPALPADVEALRESMDAFTSLNLAKAAGYSTAITDCMSNGDVGAMGVHFGNTSLIDAAVDPLHPEVLIYEPGVNGDMS